MLPTAGVVSRETDPSSIVSRETGVGGQSRKRGMESPRPVKVRRCGFGRVKAHLKLRGCWGSAAAAIVSRETMGIGGVRGDRRGAFGTKRAAARLSSRPPVCTLWTAARRMMLLCRFASGLFHVKQCRAGSEPRAVRRSCVGMEAADDGGWPSGRATRLEAIAPQTRAARRVVGHPGGDCFT